MNNPIRLYTQGNEIHNIRITEDTGTYFKRPFGLFTHVGICLGKDAITLERVFAHLHNTTRFSCIVKEREFRNGYTGELSREHKPSPFSKEEIINRSIRMINKGGTYDLLRNNCQHFANSIYYGVNRSEEVVYSMVASLVLFVSFGMSSE